MTGSPMSGRVSLINDRDQINALQDLIVEGAEEMGYAKGARFALRLAVEEAIANAFRHGHKNLPADTPVEVAYDLSDERVFVSVEDQGPGFVPDAVPDPTLDENLETPGGRGLVLMRAYMTRIAHNPTGNRVEMELRRPESV
ncbi:MAG: ATP-binding protein [Phycisphaerales bacterium]|nr:ATP-binding protein [Phycisphaerales bacterium]